MASFTIDGRSFTGRTISIINGVVIIDGTPAEGTLSGVVEIKITEGILDCLKTDANVSCGDVRGTVAAGNNVACSTVGGNVTAGNNVSCGAISGKVTAGNSVYRG